MTAIKKTISISEELITEASTVAPNFSAVVETALIEYLQHYRVKKAISSFGKWEQRSESSVDIVNQLRKEDGRNDTLRIN
jgi:hypothetical protein